MFEKYNDIVAVEDVMEMLNLGKSTVYGLLQKGQIQHVRVGKKYVIPKSAVIEFLGKSCYNGNQIDDGGLHSVAEGDIAI